MKKRIFAMGLALTLALGLTPAMAAGGADKFPAKNTYSGFGDVAENHWAATPVQICFETGLMNGKSGGFDPGGTVTLAEAIAVAARIGATLRGETIPASTDGTWYGGEVAYLKSLPRGDEVSLDDSLFQENISRYGLCLYLSIAVPESALTVKNTITALPDEDDADVLRFYNAGILSGVDVYGTFAGENPLSRAEMAAMVARIARPETALTFTLTPYDTPEYPYVAMGLPADTVILQGVHLETQDAYSIYLRDFLPHFLDVAQALDETCQEQGLSFDWFNTIGEDTFFDYAAHEAGIRTVRTYFETNVADPANYDTTDALGAKHILVKTRAEADDLRAQLKAAGDDETLFDTLMGIHSLDSGLESNPDGYSFGPDQMVAEFEAGTKALEIGQISQPIQSEHGWHIILRTEPDLDVYRSSLMGTDYVAWQMVCSFSFQEEFNFAPLANYFTQHYATP